MRCHRCEFENMPGLVKCMRCGSVLGMSAGQIDVHPPRMSRWKKPVRTFLRWGRQFVPSASWSGEDRDFQGVPEWLKKVSRVGIFGVFLSIIPGLAHLIQRRLRTIRWWVVAWLILLPLSLFFFGSALGRILLGLTLGIHVWIAVHSALLKEYESLRSRMIGYLIVLALFYIGYYNAGRLIFYNFRPGFSTINVPGLEVYQGDLLLGRGSQTLSENLTRGSFVLARLSGVANHGYWQPRAAAGYVQIIGLPGETVVLHNGVFEVNGKPLDAKEFPVPEWLSGQKFSTTVPADSYFVSAEYSGRGYTTDQAISVCILHRDRIEAKAFIRWMPLGRRGFLRDIE